MALLYFTFIAVVIIQILFFGVIFSRLAFWTSVKKKSTYPKVSIIICARNEAKNLTSNLPAVLAQKYPVFEIILVNDGSSDNSFDIIKKYESNNTNVKAINIAGNTNRGNKKAALTIGIQNASYDNLLFTDADCRPFSDQWIEGMISKLTDKRQIVLGYGAYEKIGNSFLNKLIRFETLVTAIQYFSYALAGIPYMGVGRNLAYKRQLFLTSNKFENHAHLKSGDDDLFINQVANDQNTAINISESSFTVSRPKIRYRDWINQKKRHITTSTHYKLKHRIMLGLYYVSQASFYALGFILLLWGYKSNTIILLLSFRILFQYVIYNRCAKKLQEEDLIALLPILEISLIAFQLYIFIHNIFKRPGNWN